MPKGGSESCCRRLIISGRARVLAGQGETEDAIAAGERALVLGKEAKVNTADLEKRLSEWKAKKM